MIEPPRFEHVATIDSTSAELMRTPFGDAPAPPRALLADVQTAGRGRNGRAWHGDPARSIALSVAVEREADRASMLGLPLAIGATIVAVLATHGARARLKWPNDLVVEVDGAPAKAGGILVEMRQQGRLQRVVAGFGLNLVASAALAEPRIGQRAGALFDAGAVPAREPLARELAAAVAGTIDAFARDGLAPWLVRWRALDALAGVPVELVGADGARRPGIARGIDDDGALRVELADGRLERVLAGDVSVRRAAPG